MSSITVRNSGRIVFANSPSTSTLASLLSPAPYRCLLVVFKTSYSWYKYGFPYYCRLLIYVWYSWVLPRLCCPLIYTFVQHCILQQDVKGLSWMAFFNFMSSIKLRNRVFCALLRSIARLSFIIAKYPGGRPYQSTHSMSASWYSSYSNFASWHFVVKKIGAMFWQFCFVHTRLFPKK